MSTVKANGVTKITQPRSNFLSDWQGDADNHQDWGYARSPKLCGNYVRGTFLSQHLLVAPFGLLLEMAQNMCVAKLCPWHVRGTFWSFGREKWAWYTLIFVDLDIYAVIFFDV
jgi:hypothetical protein